MWRVKIASQFYLTAPPYGSNWGHKIADFEFLPYISFTVAFIASECINRYWESNVESLNSRSVLPPDPSPPYRIE